MKAKYILLLMFSVALHQAAKAQHDLESKGVILTREGYGYSVDFTLAKYEVKTKNVSKGKDGSETFTFIDIPEYGFTYDEGKPQLPQVSFFLAIPSDMDKPDVKIVDVKTRNEGIAYRIFPSQHIMATETLETYKFVIDEAEYAGKELRNTPIVDVSEPIVVSGVRGVRVTIFPFQYNAAGKNLIVRTNAKFSISIGKPIDVKVAHTQSMDEYLNAFFVNYGDCQDAPEEKSGRPLIKAANGATAQYPKGNYLIVVPYSYYSSSDHIPLFMEHKKLLGYNVTCHIYDGKWCVFPYMGVGKDTCYTQTSVATIKTAIQNRYNNLATRPEYVLLIGDFSDLGTFHYTVDDTVASDLGYAQLDNSDYFADVKFGRWPVSNQQELENIVNKTITMENKLRASVISPKKCTLIADWERNLSHILTNTTFPEAIENVRSSINNDGYSSSFISHRYGGSTTNILNSINSGNYLMLYRGHGAADSWNHPSFDIGDVHKLTNSIYPIIFSNACETGNFIHSYTAQPCLGEAFIRSQHGACAFWGATRTTNHVSNHYLNGHIFNTGFTQVHSIAGMINIGIKELMSHLYILAQYESKVVTATAYQLFGDPSLQVRYPDCETDMKLHAGKTDTGEILQYRPATNVTVAGNAPHYIPNEYTVKNGGSLTVKANNSIMLKPGFVAESGSNFSASITAETCTPSSSNSTITSSSTVTPYAMANENSDAAEASAAVEVHPNPFSESFTLTFHCATPSNISVHLYNANGVLIKDVATNIFYDEGQHLLTVKGNELISGIYYLQVIINEKSIVHKLVKN